MEQGHPQLRTYKTWINDDLSSMELQGDDW